MENYETPIAQEAPPKKSQPPIVIRIVRLYRKMCKDVYFLKGESLLGFTLFVGEAIVIPPFVGLGIMAIVLPLSYALSLLLLGLGLDTLAEYVARAGLVAVLLGAYLFTILYFATKNVLEYKKRLSSVTLRRRERLQKRARLSKRSSRDH